MRSNMSAIGMTDDSVIKEDQEASVDQETDMDAEVLDDDEDQMVMETEEVGYNGAPSYQRRRNTWPSSLLRIKTPRNSAEEIEDGDKEKSEDASPAARKTSTRRNAWGNMSYADMITNAIESSPDKRMTLAQIYDWIVKNVQYFQDKGDSSSSASWKNSVRHNLSLHSQFTKLQNEGTGKSSWWVVKPEAAIQRRRARTMENGAFDRKRGKGKLKSPGSALAGISTIGEGLVDSSPRGRSGSTSSSVGRLSPIQAEVEVEPLSPPQPTQPSQPLPVSGSTEGQFLIPGSQNLKPNVTTCFSVPGSSWLQNFVLTVNDSSPLVTASVPATVLLMDQQVQVSTAAISNSPNSVSQAPMIVLLASPQATVPHYPQPVTFSPIPSNSATPCVTFNGVSGIQNIQNTNIYNMPTLVQGMTPPNVVANNFSAKVESVAQTITLQQHQPPMSNSCGPSSSLNLASDDYLRCRKLMTSTRMQELMRSSPAFSNKLREFLLAKREKVIVEMLSQQEQRNQQSVILNESHNVAQPGNLGRKAYLQEGNKELDKVLLADYMNMITLNNTSQTDQHNPKIVQNNLISTTNHVESPQQLEGLDVDFGQDINQDIVSDLLSDLNFDSLGGDLNCDDDFLNQF